MAITRPEIDDISTALHKSLRNHLNEVYERLIDEEIEEVAKRIRKKMKAEQDRAVLHMLDHYSMDRRGADLHITVKHLYEKPNQEE